MVENAERLISAISVDPLVVANKLLEARLVPPKLIRTMLLSSKDGYDKATELVMQVMKAVESTPEKFDVFLSILSDFLWLHDLVESVHTQYEANKQNAQREKKEVSYMGRCEGRVSYRIWGWGGGGGGGGRNHLMPPTYQETAPITS